MFILIVMWFSQVSHVGGMTSTSAEFGTQKACLAAAKQIEAQSKNSDSHTLGTLVCVAKDAP